MVVFESASSKEAQAVIYVCWGESEWRFQPLGGKSKISYHWRVRSSKLLITLLSSFIKVLSKLRNLWESRGKPIKSFV